MLNTTAGKELKKNLPENFTEDFFLIRALTHRSYVNESRAVLEDNERLEFLGDSILNFLVAEWLYQNFPEKKEGFLTKVRSALVHTHQLAQLPENRDRTSSVPGQGRRTGWRQGP